MIRVLSFLPTTDVLSTSLVCKKLHQAARDQYLWRLLFHRDFGTNFWSEIERTEAQPPSAAASAAPGSSQDGDLEDIKKLAHPVDPVLGPGSPPPFSTDSNGNLGPW